MKITIFISVLALVVSAIVAITNLRDRRARLMLRRRRGLWSTLWTTATGTLMFAGVVEVYNPSSRGNAIQEYRFWEQTEGGEWQVMEHEMYQETNRRTSEVEHSNQTPFGLPPYSGACLRVTAFSRQSAALRQLKVRIEVEDIFKKTYQTEVTATVEEHFTPPFPERALRARSA